MTLEFATCADDPAIPGQLLPFQADAPRVENHQFGRSTAIKPRPRLYARQGKRLFDVVTSALLLALLAVPMAVIALLLRLSLGKGVIYRQARVGLDGSVFTVLKFRTMHPDRRASFVGRLPNGDLDRRIQHKTVADPRHTGVGRFLRATSLDELPQLINVVRGDMSVVGPRPELVHLVDRMTPDQKARHAVRPGLTGPWQVSERGRLQLHEATGMDLDYIRQLSFGGDLKLLIRTPLALLRRTGS